MKKIIKLAGVALAVLFLTGCAGFSELVQDIQNVDASAEITAVSTLGREIVESPWDEIIFTGLGYALALLRRKYKKSKGAK